MAMQALLIILGTLVQIFVYVNGEVVYRELEDLTSEQRQLLASFKSSVSPIVPHAYMREDIYLVKYMQFNNFIVGRARHHLKQMLKWRSDNNVDEVLANPPDYFAELQRDFPVFVDGHDKENRPICEIPFGKWLVRDAAEKGLTKKLVLHLLVNCFERAVIKIREQQAVGRNVTEWLLLADMTGFDVKDHVCSACMPLALNVASRADHYYPLSNYGFWLFNTPETFTKLFRLLRPKMSPATRAGVKIFSPTEQEWKPFLEEHVDLNEISNWYGGAKVRTS